VQVQPNPTQLVVAPASATVHADRCGRLIRSRSGGPVDASACLRTTLGASLALPAAARCRLGN